MSDTLRKCWYERAVGTRKVEWAGGLFHQWGTEAAIAEGDANFSIAIIEDECTHAIVTVEPWRVNFGSRPNEESK